jgi:hypothetical protein
MDAIRTDSGRYINSIVDDEPYTELSCHPNGGLRRFIEFVSTECLIPQLNERGTPICQTTDLFSMRQTSKGNIGYRIELWQLKRHEN